MIYLTIRRIIFNLGGLAADLLLLLLSETKLKKRPSSINDHVKKVISSAIIASRIEIDISNLNQMMSIIQSILGSKALIKVIFPELF